MIHSCELIRLKRDILIFFDKGLHDRFVLILAMCVTTEYGLQKES